MTGNEWMSVDLKTTFERIVIVIAAFLICVGASTAADLHPIVEVQSGYLFGAISDGKWIKADETAELIGDETTYRVYGLTQALGEAKGGKPKAGKMYARTRDPFRFRQSPRRA